MQSTLVAMDKQSVYLVWTDWDLPINEKEKETLMTEQALKRLI